MVNCGHAAADLDANVASSEKFDSVDDEQRHFGVRARVLHFVAREPDDGARLCEPVRSRIAVREASPAIDCEPCRGVELAPCTLPNHHTVNAALGRSSFC